MSNVIVVGNGAASIAMVLRLFKEGHTVQWYGGASIRQEVTGKTIEGKPYGIAYRTSNPLHRLNAEAKAMSLPPLCYSFSFPEYLFARGYAGNRIQAQTMFAPRHVYRAYLRHALKSDWEGLSDLVSFLPEATIEDIQQAEPEDQIVLCVGATHKYNDMLPEGTIQNPWDFDYLRLEHSKRIRVYGSGLTALDTAISAWDVNPDIHVEFVSRSGRFPLLWKNVAPTTHWIGGSANMHDIKVRNVIRAMRAYVDKEGGDWQALFNGARHQWKTLWTMLDDKERARFFKVQPFWEIHRHKMIPETADILATHSKTLMTLDQLTSARVARPHVEFYFNATGVDTNPLRNPLLMDMHRKRMIGLAPQAHLGLRAGPDCKVGHRIWCVGAHMRAARWEATAMSDIVDMVDIVAQQIEK